MRNALSSLHGRRIIFDPVRAVRVYEGRVEPLLDHDAPEPELGDGETLVEIDAAAVGQLDLQIAAGTFPIRPPLPYVPGTDGAGRIVRSRRFRVGTRVWIRGAGVGVERDGCWADRIVVPDDAVHEIRDDVDAVVAASFWVPCATAAAAIEHVGALVSGERVAVRGGGGAVGSIAVQLAVLGGASDVLAIVRDPAAVSIPHATVVGAASGELYEQLGADGGIDLFVDTVGGPELNGFLDVMRPGGRIVLVGYVGGTDATFDLRRLLVRDVQLLPVNLQRAQSELFDSAQVLLARLAVGELELPITEFAIDRHAEAVDTVRTGRARGRVVLTFEGRDRRRHRPLASLAEAGSRRPLDPRSSR
jgi:NADPH2:quinone reductase